MKLGLHIISGYNGNPGRTPVVKGLDIDAEYLSKIREQCGWRTWICTRWNWKPQETNGDPAEAAQEWFSRYKDTMLEMSRIHWRTAHESKNEVPDHRAEWLRDFELERLALMHASGLNAAVGSWSVCLPALETWPIYQPVLDAMGPYDVVSIHEYFSTMHDVMDQHEYAGKVYQGNPEHVGRWRIVPQLAGKPIIVTEAGADRVEQEGAAGWKKTMSEDQYIECLRAYNAILEAAPNVLGATIFCCGNTQWGWQDFDVGDIWPRVLAEIP